MQHHWGHQYYFCGDHGYAFHSFPKGYAERIDDTVGYTQGYRSRMMRTNTSTHGYKWIAKVGYSGLIGSTPDPTRGSTPDPSRPHHPLQVLGQECDGITTAHLNGSIQNKTSETELHSGQREATNSVPSTVKAISVPSQRQALAAIYAAGTHHRCSNDSRHLRSLHHQIPH